MKLKTAVIALTAAISSQATLSYAESKPEFFGNLNVGLQKVHGETDLDGQAFGASIGVKGMHKKDGFKMIYKLEADIASAANNEDGEADIEVKNASVVFPTQYGVFVVEPRGESGLQRDMYGAIDIFENISADNSTLWGQPGSASSVFAYVTPKFNNIQVKAAVLTLNSSGTPNQNNNGNAADAVALRAIYKNEGLVLGAANVFVSEEQTGGEKTYNRSSLTAGFELGNTHLGATWEHQSDHPAPFDSDSQTLGLVADVKLSDGWSVGIGYTDKNSQFDAWDDAGTMAIVRKQITEDVYAYAEGASYSEGTVADNFSFGINVDF